MELTQIDKTLNPQQDSDSFEILSHKNNFQFSVGRVEAFLVDGNLMTKESNDEIQVDFYKIISFQLQEILHFLIVVSKGTIFLKLHGQTIWQESFEKDANITSVTVDYDEEKSLKSLSILYANALTSDFVIEPDIHILYRIHLNIPNPGFLISIPTTKYQPIRFSNITHELLQPEQIISEYLVISESPFLQHFIIKSTDIKPSVTSIVQVLWNQKINPTNVIIDLPRVGLSGCLSPSQNYVAITDCLGRIVLFDTRKKIITRILKGMRSAQCCWLDYDRDLLVVYLERGIIEVHAVEMNESKVVSIETFRNGVLSTNSEFGVVGLKKSLGERKSCQGILKTGIYIANRTDNTIFEIGLKEEILMLSNPQLFNPLNDILNTDQQVDLVKCLEILLSYQYPFIQVKALELFQTKHISLLEYSSLLQSLREATEVDRQEFDMQIKLLIEYENIRNAKPQPVEVYPSWLDKVVLVNSIPKSKSTGNFLPKNPTDKLVLDYLGFVRCFVPKGEDEFYGIKQLDEKMIVELGELLYDGILSRSCDFHLLDNLDLDLVDFMNIFTIYLSNVLLLTPKPIFWKRVGLFLYTLIQKSLCNDNGLWITTAKSKSYLDILTKYYTESDQPLLAQLVAIVLNQIHHQTNSISEISKVDAFILSVQNTIPICLLIPSMRIISNQFNLIESYSLPLLLSKHCTNNYQVNSITSKLGLTVDLRAVDAYRIMTAFADYKSGSDTSLEIVIQFVENFFIQTKSEIDLIVGLVLKQLLEASLGEVVEVLEEGQAPNEEVERVLYLTKLVAVYISTWVGESIVVLDVVRKAVGDLQDFDDIFGQFMALLPEKVKVDERSCNDYQLVTAVVYFTVKYGLKPAFPSCLFPKSMLDRYNLKRKIIALVDQDRILFTNQLSKIDQTSALEMTKLFNNI